MSTPADAPPNPGQAASEMFAHLVMQHTNMAVIFLGLAPNPQTGKTEADLDHARYFIDQLEMLEVKTKGNLTAEEQALLKQSLTHLRMAFVEAVNHPTKPAAPAAGNPAPATPAAEAAPAPAPGETAPPAGDQKKIFTKKYT